MKKGGKIALLCFFLPCEVFFVICTIPALFIFLPVGIVGLVVSTFFGLVVASIIQSIKGKKPILNLFRECTKTCKKCGTTYEKAKSYACPRCAEEKRKNQPPLPTFAEMQEARMARKARKAAFWEAVGTIAVIDELTRPKEKKQDMWARMDNDGYIDHDPGNHDVDESGYCIVCDNNVEDMM